MKRLIKDRRQSLHDSGREHAGRRCRRAAVCYAAACIAVCALSEAAETLVPEFEGGDPGRMIVILIFGGVGVFLALACFLPLAEESEYFRAFECLYHPGLCLLAAASFVELTVAWDGNPAEYLHMAYIAGWTLLAAGIIVLILIIKEKHS